MRKRDHAVAFDEVAEAAREQAGLSEVGETAPLPPVPEPVPVNGDSATARFEARLVGGRQQTWQPMVVHGVTVRLPEEDVPGTVQTTVRMSKPLREAIRQVTVALDCTFEEFVREALGMALERYSVEAGQPV